MKWMLPGVALAAYAVGLAVHELTHVVACLLTRSRVAAVHAVPPAVDYVAPDERADAAVRVSTIAASLPLLVVGLGLSLGRSLSVQLVIYAGLAGYLPRSESDWRPIASLIK